MKFRCFWPLRTHWIYILALRYLWVDGLFLFFSPQLHSFRQLARPLLTITPEKMPLTYCSAGHLFIIIFVIWVLQKKKRKKKEQAFCASAKKKNNWMCLRCPCGICCQLLCSCCNSYYFFTFTNVLRMFDTSNIQALLTLAHKILCMVFFWGGGVTAVAGSLKAPICQRHQ